jgi:hypothetical protein
MPFGGVSILRALLSAYLHVFLYLHANALLAGITQRVEMIDKKEDGKGRQQVTREKLLEISLC